VLLIRLLTASVLYMAGTSACGSARHSDESPSPENSEVLLEVENHHWSDIVIYLMNGNQSQRLGMVGAVSTDNFVFSDRKVASSGKLRLRADPIGGEAAFTSEDVLIQRGQSLKWTLETDLKRSTLAVF
jgi:hypothetical protein